MNPEDATPFAGAAPARPHLYSRVCYGAGSTERFHEYGLVIDEKPIPLGRGANIGQILEARAVLARALKENERAAAYARLRAAAEELVRMCDFGGFDVAQREALRRVLEETPAP